MTINKIILWCEVPKECDASAAYLFQALEKKGYPIFLLSKGHRETRRYSLGQLFEYRSAFNLTIPDWLPKKWIPRLYEKPEVSAEEHYEKLKKDALSILSLVTPNFLVVWNAEAPNYGVLSDIAAANGVNILHSERGLIPASIYIDEHGVLNRSSRLCYWKDTRSKFSYQELGQSVLSLVSNASTVRHRFRRYESLKLWASIGSKSFSKIFVIFGSPSCENGFAGEDPYINRSIFPLFPSYFELFDFLVNRFPEVFWVYKPHPHSKLIDLPDYTNLITSHAHPDFLIEKGDAFLFHGSKLELQAALSGKPVVLLGYGELWGSEAVFEINSQRDLSNVIQKIVAEGESVGSDQKKLRDYLGWLSQEFLYFADPECCTIPFMKDNDLEKRLLELFGEEPSAEPFVPYSLIGQHRELINESAENYSKAEHYAKFFFRSVRRIISKLIYE